MLDAPGGFQVEHGRQIQADPVGGHTGHTAELGAVGATGLSLFLHAFAVGMAFNLADWLLVDELILGRMPPARAVPPGANARDVPFERGRHFADILKGSVIFLAVAGLAMLIAS